MKENKSIWFLGGIFFLLVLMICGCSKSPQSLKPKNYINWLRKPENGLNKTKTINDLAFTMCYRTNEDVVVLNNKREEITKQLLEQELNDLGNELQYATFKIARDNSNQSVLQVGNVSGDVYTKRIAYMSFDMQNDFYLIEGNDTLDCQLFHFVRNYELAPYVEFSLGFENSKNKIIQDKTFVYEDKLFNTGILKFTIDSKDIKQIPSVQVY
ncbi:MAG: hypothetical protein ACI9LI_000268 [Saprospiraceae bacterium]|jgi:hypothetical protein